MSQGEAEAAALLEGPSDLGYRALIPAGLSEALCPTPVPDPTTPAWRALQGRIALGRILAGSIKKGQQVKVGTPEAGLRGPGLGLLEPPLPSAAQFDDAWDHRVCATK